jgi:hypothetical protein
VTQPRFATSVCGWRFLINRSRDAFFSKNRNPESLASKIVVFLVVRNVAAVKTHSNRQENAAKRVNFEGSNFLMGKMLQRYLLDEVASGAETFRTWRRHRERGDDLKDAPYFRPLFEC